LNDNQFGSEDQIVECLYEDDSADEENNVTVQEFDEEEESIHENSMY